MISIKKLATVGAAAGLLAASALPVFACDGDGCDGGFLLQKNKGAVINNVLVGAYTGDNKVIATKGGDVGSGNIDTGNATAGATVSTKLNKNLALGCGCDGVTIQKNKGFVKNEVGVGADTGSNKVIATKGGDVGSGNIDTGNATAGATVTSVVNKNVVVSF